jgi:DNA-binding MarR family transcriptional regulator
MPKLQAEDYDAPGVFRYSMRKFLRFSKDVVATYGKLTPEQYEALLAIKTLSDSTGLTIGKLGERLQVKHDTAVTLLDKLAARKLVARRRATQDRRQVYIKLTRPGNSVLAHLAEIHRREMRYRSPKMIETLRRLQK